MPHRCLLQRSKNLSGKGKGQRVKRKLKQTQMFIGDVTGNDCVDERFEKCAAGVPSSIGSIRSRTFVFVFVDNVSISRHS